MFGLCVLFKMGSRVGPDCMHGAALDLDLRKAHMRGCVHHLSICIARSKHLHPLPRAVHARAPRTCACAHATPEPGSNRGERNLYSDEMWHRRYTVLHSVTVDLRCYILSP
jgi:hypothetical protein